MTRTLQDIINESAESIFQECRKAGLEPHNAVAAGAGALIVLIAATTEPEGYQAAARSMARVIRATLAERASDAKRGAP